MSTLDSVQEHTKELIPYDRLLEIASMSLQSLFEAEPVNAEEYFKDTLELTDEERTILGLKEMRLF